LLPAPASPTATPSSATAAGRAPPAATAGFVNVKTDFNASGNGTAPAIQAAIDHCRTHSQVLSHLL
jgi:hypothetical protein